ncbi:MAG: ferrous iron transporter B [Oceanospirillaceae bacterium]|nr:ferrous iron transporter B [Oceanospirillaceae bacterium]|tara:strand:- start:287 stop:2578 length:2292 start_codon:yes stop_codon:yes gene_type:complete
MKLATIGLIGNPNCGKTTLFNQLTGTRQTVGNWPGVTVEKKEGAITIGGERHTLVDLPGTYALDAQADDLSQDEQIAREFVLSGSSDLVINIVDGSNLERNLFLTTQLLDMGVPVVCAINMLDVAEREGIQVDPDILSKSLGIPVVPIIAATAQGIDTLLEQVSFQLTHLSVAAPVWQHTPKVQNAVNQLNNLLPDHQLNPRWVSVRALEGEWDGCLAASKENLEQQATVLREEIERDLGHPIDVLIANSRYEAIQSIVKQAVTSKASGTSLTECVDNWVLNRWLGIPFFFFVMYLMFLFAINVGGAFIDFFDIAANSIFVEGPKTLLSGIGFPDWITTLLADGLGGGIQLVATFIPIIGSLYLFLSIIEDSGYMARAAFVMDRLMRAVGLPGKSFVPLIVGFGCNVPAVMAARTMDTEKDRLLTIAMSPFMSCGARLSVFALFSAAFFAENGASIVFLLYITGIGIALLTGLALKNTLFKPELTPFVMELPAYHAPNMKSVFIKTWERLRSFITRAGKTIVIVVTVLSFLNSIGSDGSFGNENNENSVLSSIARAATPVLSPIGVNEDNWPATVGVITGIFAKEAVVGTLDALYSPASGDEDGEYSLTTDLIDALATIPDNLSGLADSVLDPLGIGLINADQTEEQGVHKTTFTAMENLFGGQLAAFSYLVFVLLYTPCVATLGAMVREAGIRWMLFVAGWSTGVAYGSAVLVYQTGTWGQHPISSSVWIVTVLTFLWVSLGAMKRHARKRDARLIPITAIE